MTGIVEMQSAGAANYAGTPIDGPVLSPTGTYYCDAIAAAESDVMCTSIHSVESEHKEVQTTDSKAQMQIGHAHLPPSPLAEPGRALSRSSACSAWLSLRSSLTTSWRYCQ